MKVLVVIFAFFFIGRQVDARAITAASENLYELDADDEACIAQLNLNREEMAAVAADEIVPEDNDDFNKLSGCTGKRQGVILPNGELNYEKVAELLVDGARQVPEMTPAIMKIFKQMVAISIEYCKQRSAGTTPGQTLTKTVNCLARKLEELTN